MHRSKPWMMFALVIALATAGCADKVSTSKPAANTTPEEAVQPLLATETEPGPVAVQPEPPEPVQAFDDDTYFAMCGGQPTDLATVLEPIVADLVAQKIPYTRDPANEWRDCSGNFLRLSSGVAAACGDQQANLIAPPGVKPYSPQANNAVEFEVPFRSSRSVAKWYNDRGLFVPIYYDGVTTVGGIPAGLRQHRNLIRPGAVLWFSRGTPDSSGGTKGLFYKGDTGNRSHINHMGTVTSVRRDDNGDVIGYSMYHGHGRAERGTPASVTTHHHWSWPEKMTRGGKEYPSLGYWSQRLVGIGTLVPVVNTPDALATSVAAR